MLATVGEAHLPASRAGFYSVAVSEMWARRAPASDRERLRTYRDVLFTSLADRIRLKSVVAPVEVLDRCLGELALTPQDGQALVAALRATGLLRLEGEKFEFLHLTFPAFFRAMAETG